MITDLELPCQIQGDDFLGVDAIFDYDKIIGISITEHVHNGDGGTVVVGLCEEQVVALIDHLETALARLRGEQ